MLDNHFQQQLFNIENVTAIEKQEYNLVSLLQPKIFTDGNMWCVLYGENLQNGVAGFGSSPYMAVLEFNKAWLRLEEQK